ncbi:MAG: MBL fold metallo-hydrolase [Chitinophagaceae bacterium]
MSLYITSLNSGSNGNCYYIGNEREAILVDAGISCREIEKRMKRLGLCVEKIKAIFVSHEHSDHIAGIPVLAKKHQLPVYITEATQQHGRLLLNEHLVIRFRACEPIRVGGLLISAFPKFHDACDPHSFIVEYESVKVGIFTDIGFACDQVMLHFKQCHAAFLEANYDRDMLIQGSYPYYLKKRIMGGKGHLSNAQALQLVLAHKPSFMSHLMLSHLSKNNNCPKLVQEIFSQYAGKTKIFVASRYEETPVYYIDRENLPRTPMKMSHAKNRQIQLSLF